MTYQAYWSLSKLPFGRPESADDFFPGRPQREALARFDYLAHSGQTIGLLVAPRGAGQSTLLRRVAQSVGIGDCACEIVYSSAKDRTREQLLRQLAQRLGSQRLGHDPYRVITERIGASAKAGIRTMWLVDDATPLAAEIAGILLATAPQLSVVLGSTPERGLAIAAAVGGCALRIDLEPLDLADSARFVRHQLGVVGGSPAIFSDAALVRLFEFSEGRIGTLARLAELCLPVAAARKDANVHVDVVESIQYELVPLAA